MKYLIGLDGGGTKTKCVITDMEFKPFYECQGGPSNFLIIGTENVSETILRLILECVKLTNITIDQIASIFIGTTGAGRVSDANKLRDDFTAYASSNGFTFNKFNVDSDARIALEGAFSGKAGSLLIAGTGSIIFGKDSKGQIYRVGGFGRLLGDEGSGNTIGKRGLNQVAKDLDGRGEKTELTKLLKKHFGIEDAQQLITEVYRNNFDMAAFAPKVIEAAKNGDAAATKILEDESDELVLHVKSICRMIGEEAMKLCLVGGTITTENYYAEMFKRKIETQLSKVKIILAENPPEIGAAFMAKSML
ncbi:MAG: putative N-acetylglucosamine kinase [Ignavibacteria bacterium]|nr:MAG: putative N-acetylglucosamine kinase [Ignavibacteria bacterium]KAF0156050.1 MAG: putative N-acetylglucosamine kinase [Ignavibacteria bacterium]